MSRDINYPPVGLTLPGGPKRVMKAVKNLGQSTEALADYFEQLWDTNAIEDGLSFDQLEETRQLIMAQNNAKEELARSIAGYLAETTDGSHSEVL